MLISRISNRSVLKSLKITLAKLSTQNQIKTPSPNLQASDLKQLTTIRSDENISMPKQLNLKNNLSGNPGYGFFRAYKILWRTL
jgi:hypothetical protein